jgi:NitT/TauT family transport system ATP-binding protein
MTGPLVSDTRRGAPISISRVSKTFGHDTDRPFLALKEVSVEIDAGEFVSVVGPSGCGKSTLMLMVAGLLKRTRGDIVVGGASVTSPITDVGIAFQDHLLLDFRTALANVTLHADIRKLPRKAIDARAREPFAQLRLTQAMDKYPRQLSGGMRQRVSLDPHARPRSAADPDGRAVRRTRRTHAFAGSNGPEAPWLRRRPTVLFITHSVEEAVGLSDRILVMGPSPGEVVDEIRIDLPRPRPIVLGDVRQFSAYVDRIHRQFERLGVLHGIDVPAPASH